MESFYIRRFPCQWVKVYPILSLLLVFRVLYWDLWSIWNWILCPLIDMDLFPVFYMQLPCLVKTTSLVMREMQIKITLRFYLTSQNVYDKENRHCRCCVGQETLIVVGMQISAIIVAISVVVPQKTRSATWPSYTTPGLRSEGDSFPLQRQRLTHVIAALLATAKTMKQPGWSSIVSPTTGQESYATGSIHRLLFLGGMLTSAPITGNVLESPWRLLKLPNPRPSSVAYKIKIPTSVSIFRNSAGS